MVPEVDESTQADADEAYDEAFDALWSGPLSFEGGWTGSLGDLTITFEGAADPGRERSSSRASADVEESITLEGRFIGETSYVRSPIPQHDGVCWFTYDEDTPLVEQTTWVPSAVSAVDGEVVGFAVDRPDDVVLMSDAFYLVAAVNGKLASTLAVEDPVLVPIVVTMDDGVVARARYEMRDAVRALVDAGAELPDDMPLAADGAAFEGVVTIDFAPQDAVSIDVPDDDLLIPAAELLASGGDPEPPLCDALR